MGRPGFVWAGAWALVLYSGAPALGQELRLNATAGAAHAVVMPQQSEYGFGGGGSVSPELVVGKGVGVELELGAVGLGQGNPPSDPRFASHGGGSAFAGMAGLRVRPFAAIANSGLWFDGNGGVVSTGDEARPGFDAHVGYDWRVRAARMDVGPFVGYTQVIQSKDDVRPEDAHIVMFGVHGGFGGNKEPPPTAPIVTPPSDRDGDGVSDEDDACPDEAGQRTSDPATNGCVPDRDGPAQVADLCPDGESLATDSPDTRCAPPASVRLEGDEIVISDLIHFDVDSPRVWPDSYPLMRRIAALVIAHSEIKLLSIEGYADETGTDAHNLVLSQQRAEAVKWMLVQFHISPRRIRTQGHGRRDPRATGHDVESLRENRRVEFRVTRATPEGAPP